MGGWLRSAWRLVQAVKYYTLLNNDNNDMHSLTRVSSPDFMAPAHTYLTRVNRLIPVTNLEKTELRFQFVSIK